MVAWLGLRIIFRVDLDLRFSDSAVEDFSFLRPCVGVGSSRSCIFRLCNPADLVMAHSM